MEPFNEGWEAELHRKLKGLPDLKAPKSLALRVRIRIQVEARPWWRRPFWTWPATGRAALLVFLAAAAAVLIAAGWHLASALAPWRAARLELDWWAQLPATLARAGGLAAWRFRLPLLAFFAAMAAMATSLTTVLTLICPKAGRIKTI